MQDITGCQVETDSFFFIILSEKQHVKDMLIKINNI